MAQEPDADHAHKRPAGPLLETKKYPSGDVLLR
jgi:hypothetical protein